MAKLLLASFLAAVAVFIFGAVFWMSPPTMKIFEVPTSAEGFGPKLLEHLPASGTYLVPPAIGTPAEREAAALKGPVAIVHYRREGMAMPDPALLVRGFLVIWVTMALVSFLLQLTAPAVPTYGSRVLVVWVTGLIVAANSDLGATVWWHQSPAFAGASAIYNCVSFLIAGLILAKFIRRTR